MTDTELRAAAERVQAWSRTMMFGENTFTTKNQMAEAMDAVASKLLELLPVADDATSDTAAVRNTPMRSAFLTTAETVALLGIPERRRKLTK